MSRSWRKIDVHGEAYEYRVGKSNLQLRRPGKKPWYYPLDVVKKLDFVTIHRGRFKGTSDGMITPKDVVNFIMSVKARLVIARLEGRRRGRKTV
jgi:hypothetical protein